MILERKVFACRKEDLVVGVVVGTGRENRGPQMELTSDAVL
jgi:hypothetical protein